MSPMDGTEVFPDETAKAYAKSMWTRVLKLLEVVGFNREVISNNKKLLNLNFSFTMNDGRNIYFTLIYFPLILVGCMLLIEFL